MQDRLKSSITQPNAPELLHPIFLPLGLVSLSNVSSNSFSPSLIWTEPTLSFTDGQNHWRPGVRSICGQSCYDQRGCFTDPGSSDWRGKGDVDFIRTQLDVPLVRVVVYVYKSSFESVALTRILSPFSPVHTSACLFLRTHLCSWMGGSLRPMTRPASYSRIPSSRSTSKMLSVKVGEVTVCRRELGSQRRARAKTVMTGKY